MSYCSETLLLEYTRRLGVLPAIMQFVKCFLATVAVSAVAARLYRDLSAETYVLVSQFHGVRSAAL